MIRRLLRCVRRWHHLVHARDIEFVIAHHERLLLALPTEIRRLHQARKERLGRAATLSQTRETVSYTLGGVRAQR